MEPKYAMDFSTDVNTAIELAISLYEKSKNPQTFSDSINLNDREKIFAKAIVELCNYAKHLEGLVSYFEREK